MGTNSFHLVVGSICLEHYFKQDYVDVDKSNRKECCDWLALNELLWSLP